MTPEPSPNASDAALLRRYRQGDAAAFGEQLQDRAYEEYLTEISDTAAEGAQFRVYWPIK